MKTKLKIAFASLLMLCIAVSGFATGASDSGSSSGLVTIELWYGLSVTEASSPPADWIVLQKIRDELGIDLKLTALPSNENDARTKLLAAGASNSLPDLFQVDRQGWLSLINQRLIAPVDNLYTMMPQRSRQMYDAEARAYSTINGVSYGFANTSTIPRNEGLVIRKDWLDKLGLAIPRTSEELFTVMKAFTERDPDGNGRADTYGFGAFLETTMPYEAGLGRRFDPIMGAFGVAGIWNLDSRNPGFAINNPAYFDALTYVKRMIDERVIDPAWETLSKDDFRAAWKQGRFGIMREQMAALLALANYAPFDQNFPNGEWIVIDPPTGPQGLSSVGVFPKPYRMYAVSQRAVNAGKGAKIAELLEWMSTKGYHEIGWGVEGVNFKFGPDGAPTTEGISQNLRFDSPYIVNITQLRNMVFYNSDIEILARYPTYTTAVSRKVINIQSVLAQMMAKPWTRNDGANLLPMPNADVQRFYEQGILEFVKGTRQLTRANWDAWVAEFKNSRGGGAWETAAINYARQEGYLY